GGGCARICAFCWGPLVPSFARDARAFAVLTTVLPAVVVLGLCGANPNWARTGLPLPNTLISAALSCERNAFTAVWFCFLAWTAAAKDCFAVCAARMGASSVVM